MRMVRDKDSKRREKMIEIRGEWAEIRMDRRAVKRG
jgi:hypothetical protein